MKKLLVLFLVLIVVSLAITSCGSESTTSSSTTTSTTTAPTKTTVLRIAFSLPPMNRQVTMFEPFADSFNERANGEYKIEIFAGESLVKMGETLEAVKTGAAEMASMPPSPESGKDIRFAGLGLPFMSPSVEAHIAACENIGEVWGPMLEEKFNQKPLAICAGTNLHLLSVDKPIKTLEDWEGLLCWSNGVVTSAQIEALGATPVTVPWPEMFSGAQKGIVTASVCALDPFVDMQMWEVFPYVTLCNLSGTDSMININLDVWNEMPKNIQDILQEEMKGYQDALNQAMITADDEMMEVITTTITNVYTLPDSEWDKWAATCTEYNEAYFADLGSDGQKMKEILEEAMK